MKIDIHMHTRKTKQGDAKTREIDPQNFHEIISSTDVKITLYDVGGKELTTLLDQAMNVGYHEIEFDGTRLSSGVYFYSIQAGSFREMKKMILLK